MTTSRHGARRLGLVTAYAGGLGLVLTLVAFIVSVVLAIGGDSGMSVPGVLDYRADAAGLELRTSSQLPLTWVLLSAGLGIPLALRMTRERS